MTILGRKTWWRAERQFDRAQLRAARGWAADQFAEACDLRADCLTVLSELTGNVAVHSNAQTIHIALEHSPDGLHGHVHEYGPARGHVQVDNRALTEMHALTLHDDDTELDIDALTESGRGLAIATLLCGERWHVAESPTGRTIRFGLTGCRCQIRAAHPHWGILGPECNNGLWSAVRKGYPNLLAESGAQLLNGLAEAERLR